MSEQNNRTPEQEAALKARLEKARLAKAAKKIESEAKGAESSEIVKTKLPARNSRKSMTSSGPLGIREDLLDHDNFQYRWVEDKGWNMSLKRELGYEFEQDPTGAYELSGLVIPSKFGAVVGRVCDQQGTIQYLMKMPRDMFQESRRLRAAERDVEQRSKPSGEVYEKQFDIDTK